MLVMKSKKRHPMDGREKSNQDRIRTNVEKETLKKLENIGS